MRAISCGLSENCMYATGLDQLSEIACLDLRLEISPFPCKDSIQVSRISLPSLLITQCYNKATETCDR